VVRIVAQVQSCETVAELVLSTTDIENLTSGAVKNMKYPMKGSTAKTTQARRLLRNDLLKRK